MKKMIACVFALLLSGTVLGIPTIVASKDNTLYQATAGGISNGAGDYIFAGVTAQGVIHRVVIAFDVAAIVPQGAVITDAGLDLTVSRFAGGQHPTSLHALTRDWGEGTSNASAMEGRGTTATTNDATWTKAFHGNPGVAWTTPGGDYVAASDSDSLFAGLFGVQTFTSPALIARVQSWLDNPSQNFGWIVIGEEAFTGTSVRYNSRTNPDTTSRPKLHVAYRCPADWDNNGTIDLFDYLDFVQDFAANAPAADFNHDQVIDFFDYLDYLRAFAGGC